MKTSLPIDLESRSTTKILNVKIIKGYWSTRWLADSASLSPGTIRIYIFIRILHDYKSITIYINFQNSKVNDVHCRSTVSWHDSDLDLDL